MTYTTTITIISADNILRADISNISNISADNIIRHIDSSYRRTVASRKRPFPGRSRTTPNR